MESGCGPEQGQRISSTTAERHWPAEPQALPTASGRMPAHGRRARSPRASPHCAALTQAAAAAQQHT
eukprot:4985073-Lingulodinium_polyedra.AAC.2